MNVQVAINSARLSPHSALPSPPSGSMLKTCSIQSGSIKVNTSAVLLASAGKSCHQNLPGIWVFMGLPAVEFYAARILRPNTENQATLVGQAQNSEPARDCLPGLAIVKEIATLHGAQIFLRDAVHGSGSLVVVCFALARPSSMEP